MNAHGLDMEDASWWLKQDGLKDNREEFPRWPHQRCLDGLSLESPLFVANQRIVFNCIEVPFRRGLFTKDNPSA